MRSCDFTWSLLFNINKYKFIYNLCKSRIELEFNKKISIHLMLECEFNEFIFTNLYLFLNLLPLLVFNMYIINYFYELTFFLNS